MARKPPETTSCPSCQALGDFPVIVVADADLHRHHLRVVALEHEDHLHRLGASLTSCRLLATLVPSVVVVAATGRARVIGRTELVAVRPAANWCVR